MTHFYISNLEPSGFKQSLQISCFCSRFQVRWCFVFQGALVGGLTSLVFVGWLVIGAQAEIASGAIKFQWKPMSTAGCTGNLTHAHSPLSAAVERYRKHGYSHIAVCCGPR